MSSELFLTNISNKNYSGLNIVNTPSHCVSLTNCFNLVIDSCEFIGSPHGEGVYMYNCHNIVISNCYFQDNISSIYCVNCSNITVKYNHAKGILGPKPRGQFIQFNGCSGDSCYVGYNLIEQPADSKYQAEDFINVYNSIFAMGSPLIIENNYIRAQLRSSASVSGGGIMLGDDNSSNIIARNNILVDPGQYGCAISGGRNNQLIGNTIYGVQQSFTNVGLYVWKQVSSTIGDHATVENNNVYFVNKYGHSNNFWNANNISNTVWTNNNSLPSYNVPSVPPNIGVGGSNRPPDPQPGPNPAPPGPPGPTPAPPGPSPNPNPNPNPTPGPTPTPTPSTKKTIVNIHGSDFYINGVITPPSTARGAGGTGGGGSPPGLLVNSRMVQAIFDDSNAATVSRWVYPDTKVWDAARNVREFVAAVPSYKAAGCLAVTVNLCGGGPVANGFSNPQPWNNCAYNSDGSLKQAYMDRLKLVLDALDAAGMVCILGYYYFGQEQRLISDGAIVNGAANVTRWLIAQGYTNILIEIANESSNSHYTRTALQPSNIPILIHTVKSLTNIPVSCSFNGGVVPPAAVMAAADYIILHGNGCTPATITSLVNSVKSYHKPIIFNEDSTNINNCHAAIAAGASWGYYDQGSNNYVDGFQSPPVNWTINTASKRAFF